MNIQQAIVILENDPNQWTNVKGIGQKKLAGILKSHEEQRFFKEFMFYLAKMSNPFANAHAYKIYKVYGVDALQKFQVLFITNCLYGVLLY